MENNVFTRLEVEYMRSLLQRNSAILPDVRMEGERIGQKLFDFLSEHTEDTRFIIVGFDCKEDNSNGR